jgi:hypothetical protein
VLESIGKIHVVKKMSKHLFPDGLETELHNQSHGEIFSLLSKGEEKIGELGRAAP